MRTAKDVMDKVLYYIDRLREKYPEVQDKDLLSTEPYYLNMDGTKRHWEIYKRTPSFTLFWESTKIAFISVHVSADGFICGTVFSTAELNRSNDFIEADKEEIGSEEAKEFAYALQKVADERSLHDCKVSRLHF